MGGLWVDGLSDRDESRWDKLEGREEGCGGREGVRTEREDEIDKGHWEEGGSKIPWEEYDGREGG